MAEELVLLKHPFPHVVEVVLNRPKNLNALNTDLFDALSDALSPLLTDEDAYVVVIRGEGKHFCAGLDLMAAAGGIVTAEGADTARRAMNMRKIIERFQKPCDILARLPQVTIACTHGACMGAGVDIAAACDIRCCAEGSKFSIKEIDVGLAADLGSLHRMPLITGNMSWVRELAFTGREFGAQEALRFGFVSQVAPDEPALREAVHSLAKTVAAKSPIALRATKEMCAFAESHGPEECMRYVRTLNGAMLQTEDMAASMKAFMTKKAATFSKL